MSDKNQIAPSEIEENRYPSLEIILNVIELLRRRWFWINLCRVTLFWVALLFVSSTFVCLTAGKISPTDGGRWILLSIWLLSLFTGPMVYVYLLMFRQPGSLTLAALAEKQGRLQHDYLTNALQLADDPFWSSRFVARVIAESAQAAGTLRPETVLPNRQLRNPAATLGISVLVSMIFLLAAHETVRAGFTALFHSQNRTSTGQPTMDPQNRSMEGLDFSKLLQVQITGRFPPYLQKSTRELTDTAGPLEIPEGTELEFTVLKKRRDREGVDIVSDLRFKTASGARIDLSPDETNLRYRADWKPAKDDGYAFTGLYNRLQLRWPMGANPYWPIKLIKDLPPTVRLAEPGEDVELPPGSKIQFTIVAEDDHSLSDLKLFVNSSVIYHTTHNRPKQTASVTWEIPKETKIASSLDYFAQAKDNRDLPGREPQTVQTKKYHIKIISPTQYKDTQESSLTSLREQLQLILERQIHCRVITLSANDPTRIAYQQKNIHTELEKLATQSYPAGLTEIGRIIKTLTNGPAAQAAALSENLDAPAKFQNLLSLQQEIIITLESILQMLQEIKSPADQPAKTSSLPAEDPSLQKLSDLLGKFIDQQRLALRSTQDLAGKTPEDFSAKDKAALDELKQLQEKWDRFLQQAINDMDKLARQDFSASVSKQELVEIQSQVKLTEDAMKQQSMLMAIKAEQIGLELATELLHNIERWLSDVPDRLKWDLEEPPASIDVPLAQLPEELEDIIGDLIEKEEDLYDQIEDQTSSWADSLDKGAGWQVMDGPISNFSAKGITGNLLPNQNEIGGRSGEGRTGRSSGEFVEQTAKGKGGRRTPTRLTKDAFQPGQIDDQSKEPAGGATGGGKLSGAGTEGLTGPRPKQMMPNLPGLKEKQALLLSKTKMAQWQAQKNNWGNFQLGKVIKLMAANKTDLDRGAYRSVIARKNILIGSLKTSRTLLESKFQLDQPDQKLPKSLQAQMQNPDPQAIPENLRPILNKYYELLSQQEK
ncbi:MAG: hypothetical protein WC975_06675 [Phycisphaerae bacterium]